MIPLIFIHKLKKISNVEKWKLFVFEIEKNFTYWKNTRENEVAAR